MPAKNTVKIYVENGIYHIYNRGVEKRDIFHNDQDYHVFLNYLKEALSPPPSKDEFLKTIHVKGLTFKGIPKLPKNFAGKIELFAYCLMPNHFHLLLKQSTNKTIKEFMQSLATRYSMFFNKKYKRVGNLFQSVYKAILIEEEPYLLHLSRYIHRNPREYTNNLTTAYSSYSDYLKLRKTPWINTNFILDFFDPGKLLSKTKIESYQQFVEYEEIDSLMSIEDLALEETTL